MATPKPGQSATASTPKTPGSTSSGSTWKTWGTRALNLMRPNFGKDSTGKGGASRITKLIFGTLIFVLVGQLLVTAMTLLNNAYHLGLNAPVFAGTPWLNWFFAIYFLLLIGLWFLLNYLGFFPKPEPLPAGRGRGGAGGAKKGVTQIPGIGGPHVRAKAPEAPAPAAPARKSFFGGRSSSPAATAQAAAKADPKTLAAINAATTPGDYDDAYERVKAAQRLKRRRTLR